MRATTVIVARLRFRNVERNHRLDDCAALLDLSYCAGAVVRRRRSEDAYTVVCSEGLPIQEERT